MIYLNRLSLNNRSVFRMIENGKNILMNSKRVNYSIPRTCNNKSVLRVNKPECYEISCKANSNVELHKSPLYQALSLEGDISLSSKWSELDPANKLLFNARLNGKMSLTCETTQRLPNTGKIVIMEKVREFKK